MVYTSLTEAPHNLKDGIDWLIALRGTDAEANLKAMGAAIHKLLADKPVGYTEVPGLEAVKQISKEFMEKPELKYHWCVERLLKRFNKPMGKAPSLLEKWFGIIAESDYANVVQNHGFDRQAMSDKLAQVVDSCDKFLNEMKDPDHYTSAYGSDATWAKSCAKDPEACAVILVGVAPMLYTGLRSLWDVSFFAAKKIPPFNSKRRLLDMLKAVGYGEPVCPAGIGASDVRKAFNLMEVDIFTTLYDLGGFWAFYGDKNAANSKSLRDVAPADSVEGEGRVGEEPEGEEPEGEEPEGEEPEGEASEGEASEGEESEGEDSS
ncbi:hypothetical protein BBBOND_0402000 [Babesia bigemina]|uniref:Uncharacterized protein n=1 Tax=Babesia bigemina TaxID=5866 RepID=A0A061DAX9_BABBI|nr:hypothetical protein BBBOND_0402000 [Babesia bigemina]CDR97708.1 hypothetical protein BBBOND_0402000 [Babesia bigemina]|eukprot:XP_012769894.1 hypothetical protein BBBOND_0402000 [Babesia bigemina]